jgi:hypothetical protein
MREENFEKVRVMSYLTVDGLLTWAYEYRGKLRLRRGKNLHKGKVSTRLYSLLNLIINGGNVEFGLGDADLVHDCKINNV